MKPPAQPSRSTEPPKLEPVFEETVRRMLATPPQSKKPAKEKAGTAKVDKAKES